MSTKKPRQREVGGKTQNTEAFRLSRGLVAGLAVLAVALFVFWRRGSDTPEPEATEPRAEPRRTRGRETRRPSGLLPAAPEEGAGGADSDDAPTEPEQALPPGQGRYAELYMGRSGRLPPGAQTRGADAVEESRSGGGAPILVASLPSSGAQAGDEAALRARLLDESGEPLTPSSIVAEVRPEEGPEGAGTAGRMVPSRRRQAPPGEHELRFRPPRPPRGEGAPEVASWRYEITATGTHRGEAFERVATGAFKVHAPGARVDPKTAQVERKGGDLVVRFALDVERKGAYWGYAKLWGGPGGDVPIAFGQRRWDELEPGRHALSLLFGGQVLRDVGVDGPYWVKNVKLVQVDTRPYHRQAPIGELATTPAWEASSFE